jgi:hypothetical protein
MCSKVVAPHPIAPGRPELLHQRLLLPAGVARPPVELRPSWLLAALLLLMMRRLLLLLLPLLLPPVLRGP